MLSLLPCRFASSSFFEEFPSFPWPRGISERLCFLPPFRSVELRNQRAIQSLILSSVTSLMLGELWTASVMCIKKLITYIGFDL
jgi:hypothetical protein